MTECLSQVRLSTFLRKLEEKQKKDGMSLGNLIENMKATYWFSLLSPQLRPRPHPIRRRRSRASLWPCDSNCSLSLISCFCYLVKIRTYLAAFSETPAPLFLFTVMFSSLLSPFFPTSSKIAPVGGFPTVKMYLAFKTVELFENSDLTEFSTI